MAPDPPDVLERRMNRAITTFNKQLDELRNLLNHALTPRSEAVKTLAKVKAFHDAAVTACTPVIDCYEKLNTDDANDKVESTEETRDKVKIALIDVTCNMEQAFPIPAANAGGASQNDALVQVAQATTAAAANNFLTQTWEEGEIWMILINFLILFPISKVTLFVSSADTTLLPTIRQQHMLPSKLNTGKRSSSSRIFYVNYYG